ncbi:hypothetical protein JYB88_09880 [Shewanella cyperi]|uniref:Peptidyl-prolyl cis-trans isomerase n=1 Tax=Shewanella cyperi TaxID=2814292 RepID=A0A974XKD2_9GAMM|nr:hypothetical protein [Shewanella cyperi]QSX28601.1 hypothetical protein JYB88_09880 [Shewanella cyperi]
MNHGRYAIALLSLLPLWAAMAAGPDMNADTTALTAQADTPGLSQGLADSLYRLGDGSISRGAFDAMLLEQWRLARYHDRDMPESLWQQGRAGYDMDYLLRANLSHTLEQLFPQLRQLPVKLAASRVQASRDSPWVAMPDMAELLALLKAPNPLGYELSGVQQQALGERIAIELGESEQISLAQIFNEQSVQGRQKLLQADTDYWQQLIARRAMQERQTQWLLANSLLSGAELDILRYLTRARLLYPKLLAHFGVGVEQHGDNPALQALAAEVTGDEIRAFYHQYPQRFQRLTQAEAEVWCYGAQSEAEQARRKNAAERNREQAPSRVRLADDATRSVELPCRKGNDIIAGVDGTWLRSLAAALPERSLSQPVRSPEGLWLLLQTGDKAYDLYPEDSETTAFIARNALAADKAWQRWQALRRQLGLPPAMRPADGHATSNANASAKANANTKG